jgi:uncharacterized membrane protein
MSANKILGVAFIVIWLLCIWIVLRVEDKNKIISQLLRISEIGLFLLPISALVLTFVIGSQAVNSTTGAAQAGAAIGVAVGGMMAVVLGFMVGVAGGIIMHLLSNRFEKKITDKSETKATNFFERHKAVTIILALLILIIVASAKSGNKQVGSTQDSAKVASTTEQKEPEKPKEPSPVTVEKATVGQDMIGTPQANVTFKNTSKKEIDGIKARIKTFNNFDEPVNGFMSDNTFDAISQDKIAAGKINTSVWTMYNFDTTSKIKVEVYNVHFTDGTTWEE